MNHAHGYRGLNTAKKTKQAAPIAPPRIAMTCALTSL
jgi:hypothetical protein